MTTYTTTEINAMGNTFAITVAKGQHNYINVTKLTNNPFRTAGKDFKSFDEATGHYKSPDMKVALLKLELNLA